MHAFLLFFSGVKKAVEEAPVDSFNPLSTQKHWEENGPKRCFLTTCPGAPISCLLCQLLLALRTLEIVLTAAPCEGETPFELHQSVNKLAIRDLSELVIKGLEVTLTMWDP